MDMFATISDFEQVSPPNPLDGKSLKSLLLQTNTTSPHDFLFHYCGMHSCATQVCNFSQKLAKISCKDWQQAM